MYSRRKIEVAADVAAENEKRRLAEEERKKAKEVEAAAAPPSPGPLVYVQGGLGSCSAIVSVV